MHQFKRTLFIQIAFTLLLLTSVYVAQAGQPDEEADILAVTPINLLDPASMGGVAAWDYDSAAFELFKTDVMTDYLMIDQEIISSTVDGQVNAGVWHSNSTGLTQTIDSSDADSEFGTAIVNYTNQMMRPIDLDGLVENGSLIYKSIWVSNSENLNWRISHNMTAGEYAADVTAQTADDYYPIDVEVYADPVGDMKYAVIWVENGESLGWHEHTDLTLNEFDTLISQYETGFSPIDIESWNDGGTQKYAAVWVAKSSEIGNLSIMTSDLTANDFRNHAYRNYDLGYRLIDIERYEHTDGDRYAGIWQQNSGRPDWSLKDEVDQLVTDELTEHDAPGFGVAVIADGEIQYMRGFGYQDINDDIWYSSQTINRLASISKAMAGVLGLELAEKGLIDLDEQTRTYEPSLPSHQVHTLRQLLANRGGVGSYGELGSQNSQFETALAAAQFMVDDPLHYTAGEGCYYSTHGYTFFGLGVEGALGSPIQDVLEEHLTGPLGLTSMQKEDRTDGNWLRAKLYTTNNVVAWPDNISWKVLGGGTEANVLDVARFGEILLGNSILTPESLEELWIPLDSCTAYGLGWDIKSSNGRRVISKDGSQWGADTKVLVYPDHGIVVAVVNSKQSGGHSSPRLADAIGDLVVSDLSEQIYLPLITR